MKSHSEEHKGIALTVMATLCWGGGIVLSKISLNGANENSLFLIQLLCAWISVLLVTLAGRKLSLREWRHGWLGILEPGIAFYLGLIGLAQTSAVNATILQSLEGLMIIGFSFVFFKGKVSSRTLLWGALSTIGAVLVTTRQSILMGVSVNTGDCLVLLGTIFAAVYVTLSSRVVGERNSAESLLFWQLSYCVVAIVAYQAVRGELSVHLSQINIYAVSSGALTYGLSFYFYLWGMKYIPTSLSAILLCLTPIFGVLLSVAFLSESVTQQNMLGFGMILVSSYFLTRQSSHTGQNPAATF